MAIEGLETTNEELQSANEELQSANEELQSSNEELQSLNEELHTLNTEHQLRIKELVELNDDLNNYFRSTEIGQIFLDSSLRIRKFNPAATKIVNIIDSDIGRPISNISTNIRFSDLVQEVRTVMEKNTLAEKEVELNNGVNCLMRILPYVRQDKRVDGVVISFVDVSVVKELNSVVQGVFDTSISGILVFESERNGKKITDFRATAANGAAEAIFRKSAFETVGESFCKDFPGLAAHGLFDRCIQVVETGESLVTELSIEESEGNVEWYHVVANKLKDGLIMTFTNISRRKQAEDKLRRNYNELLRTKESLKQLNAQLELMVQTRTKDLAQSEERFRLVASSTSDAIWDWNFADNTVWWSDSFYTLFGYPPEAAGINTSSFRMSLIHADDRERVQNSIHELINSDVTEWKQEYRLRKSDGSYATILDRGTVMHDENGVPFRMLGAMMDITMAAQTQEQLRTKNFELQNLFEEFKFVTDFMPQMVWSTKADGNHDFYNQRWYDYTGLNFEATRDKGWELVLHPDDLERTWKIWDESLATGKTYEIEYRIRRHDGVYRWFLGRAIPLRDAEGQIVKWFGTCTDVHDQKTMSDVLEQRVQERTLELQRSNQDLESSNNELMQFASIASHDLKEPLRKIHIFSTLIRDRYFQNEPHGASDYLDRIIRSSSRMTKLINDLLNYSRLSAESLFTATNLNQIVEEVLTDIELAVDDKDAKILVESLPVVEAIPGQMRQIFQNLISNSLKFCREGVPPRVEIGCELIQELKIDAPRAEQGPYVRITLKDNGIGFDEQYAAKIFTIFQRLHSREKYDGTGIGLAIAKKIIEKHNGIISAFSKEGEGATFVIVLPLKQPRLPE
jgi:two-component system CheB/CheR fusion protein